MVKPLGRGVIWFRMAGRSMVRARKKGSDPAQATNNLRLPKPLAILFLYRNLHRVHHLAPKTLWYQTEKAYIKQGDPGLPFRPFLRRYLAEGPRLWGVR